MPNPDDHRVAAELASEAGELLLDVRAEMARAGAPPAELKATGDRRSHDLLMSRLRQQRPDDAILSEEAADDRARLGARRVWIVDPLDGTREFGEPPRTDWAVHVALVEGESPIAGAVALPALGLTFGTAEPPEPPRVPVGVPRIICSRTRPGPAAELLAERLDGELVHMGSAGAKTMAVVRGEAEIYAHTGGQYEWDSCAPVAVAQAAGLHASRLDGSPLRYNQPNPYLPDLLVCRPELAPDVLAIMTQAS